MTYEDQQKLIAKYPQNEYLSGRGVAGTHDMQLAVETLTNLIEEASEGQDLLVPSYEKSCYSGKGDRAPLEKWGVVSGKVDLVIVEGWMLGYKQRPAEFFKGDPNLAQINEFMAAYEQQWHPFFDSMLLVGVPDSKVVYEWREQAENNQRRSKGLGAMSQDEIRQFCHRFIVCYDAYMHQLMTTPFFEDAREEETRVLKMYLTPDRWPFCVDESGPRSKWSSYLPWVALGVSATAILLWKTGFAFKPKSQ